MTEAEYLSHFEKWKAYTDYKVPMEIKKGIIIKIYKINTCAEGSEKNNKLYAEWMLKKLNNVLKNNREELMIDIAKNYSKSQSLGKND